MTRCDACPTPADAVCLAIATGHARFCDWARSGGAKREHVRARSLPAGSPVPDTVVQIHPMTARVVGCPSRRSECHCLDVPAYCERDRVMVDKHRCFACKSSGE